ncbi:MAG TPA: hypothetical protein VFJ68_00520 [Casimicrobiaceae bacterium]|nr:hypothetical protein [Casimicrobiaceae bacterium]
MTPTGISYQGAPCSGEEMPVPMVIARAAETPSRITARAMNETALGVPNDVTARSANDVASEAANDSAARGAPRCDPRPREPKRLPWRQATICIGMTDDEVLNLPGWGRPAKIVRTRAPREWREQWFYDTRFASPRQLFFVNGTLATVEREFAETPGGQIVGLGSALDAARTATN